MRWLNVRYWPKADKGECTAHVRFWGVKRTCQTAPKFSQDARVIRADLGPQGNPLRDKCDFVPSDANFFAIVAMSEGTRSRFPNFHVKRHRLTSDVGRW